MALFSQALVASSVCWMIASSLWIYPHSLSYFNESIGGPLNGHKHLLGSNVDWGQDRRYLAWWVHQYGPGCFQSVACFGPGGVSTLTCAGNGERPGNVHFRTRNGTTGQDQWHALSANILFGCSEYGYSPSACAEFHRVSHRATLCVRVGYSLYVIRE
jgi:hypothetical protein